MCITYDLAILYPGNESHTHMYRVTYQEVHGGTVIKKNIKQPKMSISMKNCKKSIMLYSYSGIHSN